MTTTSTATQTPAEIDGQLAPLEAKHAAACDAAYRYAVQADKETMAHRIDMYRDLADTKQTEADDLLAQITPLRAEYLARGGWTRAFLCTASNGHLHRNTHCTTTYATTQFAWCTELSGMDETEIVELAGERACTVCYPDAPVATLARPSRLALDVQAREEKAARDAELAAKRAAKAAKAITAPDGTPLRGSFGTIATVVTAWQEATANVADHRAYGYRFDADLDARIVEALVAKLGETEAQVRATLAKKVAAKIKRG